MAGILDFLDNPDTLGQLLGISPAQAQPQRMPMPRPAPPSPIPSDQFGPTMANGERPGFSEPGYLPQTGGPQPPAPAINMPMPRPQDGPGPGYLPQGESDPGYLPQVGQPAVGGIGSDAARVPMQPGNPPQMAGGIGSDAARQAPGEAQPPWPMPPAAAGAPPAAMASAAPSRVMPPPQGAPLPPPNAMPPVGQGNAGGLAGALGLNPQQPMPTTTNPMRAAVAGVGHGLSAVGRLQPGASKGVAFGAGAGGALEGLTQGQDKADATDRANKNDLFNQSSTAFKDMMLAKNSDDTAGYRKAQSQYLAARAASLSAMTANGGKGSNAYQNTPEFKVLRVEEDAAKWEKGQQLILQKRWQLNGSTQEQQDKDLENLAKKVEAFKGNLYKQSGIDPKQAEKLRTRGEDKDNPFDTKGMSIETFHKLVPLGSWYKDQNGVPRQRTVPPPEAGTPPGAAPGPGAAVNQDDVAAMTDAAA